MADQEKQPLEKRVQQAILQNAFFRWESAVVISLTLLLTVFAEYIPLNVPAWVWFLGGLVSEAAIVYSSLTDPEAGRKVVAEMLRDEFQPERLHDKQLQQQVQEAFDYRSRITAAIRERRDSVLKDSLSETAGQIDEWLESIYNLARRLDRYRQEKEVLERDKRRALERSRQLETRLPAEKDPAVRGQIEETLENLRRQMQTIDTLENTMERAQLQLETTLSSLGTIYSQTMLAGAKDIDSARAKRLRQEIAEEVQELDNVLVAMDEVYAGSGAA
ncbi:MAG: hypothetical protein L0332_02210 [Chloroflexi bacterium]|nr:hypothetical protein [Chloroflexota bacterium]MCI0577545.1 hypothetical protein [Chloroflexota bacterium]MCI0645616.1 hypothetical protein [Chloroflexota bacterium]MCI0725528.1 hypothetical protein [Chloroflexota bacterium]